MSEGMYLGVLCGRGHDHEGSGKSLRYSAGHCKACHKARLIERLKNPEVLAKHQRLMRERQVRLRDRRNEQAKKYKLRNRERLSVRRKELRALNRDRLLKIEAQKRDRTRVRIREIDKEFKRRLRKNKPELVKKYAREYYSANSTRMRLRNRVRKAIVAQGGRKERLLSEYGIDVTAIERHIGACPGSLRDYEIDHVIPLCSFDLNDPAQIAEAFAPENHQWLTRDENRYKAAKYARP